MKTKILFLSLVLCALVALWQSGTSAQKAVSAEQAAARVPLENYLRGHATGGGEYFKKSLSPGSKTFLVS